MTASQASDVLLWLSAIFGMLAGIWIILFFILAVLTRKSR